MGVRVRPSRAAVWWHLGREFSSSDAGRANILFNLNTMQYLALTLLFGTISSGLPAMIYAWTKADLISED
jgi:hypothetical protein